MIIRIIILAYIDGLKDRKKYMINKKFKKIDKKIMLSIIYDYYYILGYKKRSNSEFIE